MPDEVKETLFCMKRLEKQILELNGNDPTPEQAYLIMVTGFSCFIEFANEIAGRVTKIDRRSKERTSPRWWFVDRVLPTIISTAILSIVGWIFLVNSHVMGY